MNGATSSLFYHFSSNQTLVNQNASPCGKFSRRVWNHRVRGHLIYIKLVLSTISTIDDDRVYPIGQISSVIYIGL